MLREIGSFEVLDRIGQGGMGMVYRARQPGLARDVALKELRFEPRGDLDLATRFLQEARISGSLAHPSIVVVYDYFELEGAAYIAMEYLDRGSLASRIKQLDLAQSIGVLESVLAGLAYAGERGVVHRDLKPANLLITSDGRTKIADFGIAKAYDCTSEAGLTAPGQAIGTPAYMAPEQALAQAVDPRTDLYATGVIAYEMLAGQPPFDPHLPWPTLMFKHVHVEPPPLASVKAAISPRLSGWVEGLLAKDPSGRPPDAATAWAELEEIAVELLGWRWRQAGSARAQAAKRVGVVARRAAARRNQLRAMETELAGDLIDLQAAVGPAALLSDPDGVVVCPFKGLAPFETADTTYFFGRERLVAELVARLVGAPLLGVVGPSGSGKSSVLRAGLLPALASGVLPGSDAWPHTLIRPGEHPMRELKHAAAAVGGDRRPVLAVDQFEEIFTVCRDEQERSAFMAELVRPAGNGDRPGVVVLAIRADHYGSCAEYPELARLLATNHVLVGPMQRDELTRVVERPAALAGLRVEPELVDALVADVAEQPGALPLLSTALLELWQRRDGRLLGLDSYRSTGGVQGAVARLAEDAFSQLAESQQALARTVLLRLAEMDDEGRVERRRVPLEELDVDRNEDIARVVGMLADRRLLTVSAGSVEVAHEALLREWPRLRAWLEENAQGRRLQRRVTETAAEWIRLQRDSGALLRGAQLAEASEWSERDPDSLNELEREFVTTSLDRRKQEEVARRRRGRHAFAGLLIILLIVSALAVVAFVQVDRATHERDTARAALMASRALGELSADPGHSLVLAMEAFAIKQTDFSEGVLRLATSQAAPQLVLKGHAGPVFGVAFAADGRHVASAGEDGTVRMWDWSTPRTPPTVLRGHGGPVYGVAFAADGRHVASAGSDKTVRVWDWSTAGTLPAVLRGHGGPVYGVAFAPDGRHLASASVDKTVRVWDRRVPHTAPIVLRGHREPVYGAAFAPDGRHMASASEDGTVRVWDWRAPRTPPTVLRGHGGPVYGVAFAADGRHVASAGEDGAVRVWNWRAPHTTPTILRGHTGTVYGVAFAADGRHVASGGSDNTVRLWDWRAPRTAPTVLRGRGHTGRIYGVAFAADGRHVASGGSDNTVRLWGWRAPRTAPTVLRGHGGSVVAVAFARDGRHVASAGGDGTVRVWDWRAPQVPPTILRGHGGRVDGVAFAADGRHVASAGSDKTVRVWDWSTPRTPPTVLRGHGGPVYGVAFAADGRHVASANEDGAVRVWDWRAPRTPPTVLRGHGGLVNGVAFARDGRHVASAGVDETVRVWDWRAPHTPPTVLRGHDGPVNGVAFAANGRAVAGAGEDGAVRVWNWRAPRTPPTVLRGHGDSVAGVAFAADGRHVASAGEDGTVRMWDWRAPQVPPTILRGHGGPVDGVAFAADGRHLASGSEDGTLRVWECQRCGDIRQILKLARARLPQTIDARTPPRTR